MPITCKLCNRTFDKLITNKHLKFAHNITVDEYRNRFGSENLSCPEYRKSRSQQMSGAGNTMYGKKHTAEARKRMGKKGQIPHNKGKKVTDEEILKKIRKSITERERRYQETGYHPRRGAVLSVETKEKISKSVSEYAKTHKDELVERAAKIVDSKREKGYFDKLKENTKLKRVITWESIGYSIEHQEHHIVLTHNACGNKFHRNKASWINPQLCSVCFDTISVSKGENELKEWLTSILPYNIVCQDRFLLDGFEIDILIPDLNIGIEYNGLYWHSEEAGKSKWYHVTKYNKCIEKNIRLIQIFEDEWIYRNSIVKNRLIHILGLSKCTEHLYPRDCEVVNIAVSESRAWHEQHHIQGRGNGTISYALHKDGVIKAVMDFAKLNQAKGYKHSNDNTWELTRFSTNVHIPGAAGKLFQTFVRHYNPQTVISYSDRRWNTGAVYEKIGFHKEGATLPNYWYVLGDKRYHRYSFRKDQLIKEGYDPNKTEQQIMRDRGYYRIWDCGHDKWIWSKNSGSYFPAICFQLTSI